MRDFKFSKQTSTVALVFFAIYFTYGIFRLPFVQYLVCLAVGAITYGICESYEIAVVALLAMNLIFPMISGGSVRGIKGQQEGFMASSPSDISARVSRMKKAGIRGVGSPMTEGFEDADSTDMSLSETKKKGKNSEDVTATSKPAEAEAEAEPEAEAEAEPEADAQSESFQDNSGLFKLGQIPSEAKGGFHIDAGTTVMNALKALKPDQINAMTKDTKQLIETQKSLMNMLQTFTPMVKEGKQMMDTFGSMFNPAAGSAMGSLQASQGIMGA